jgi:sortase A
MLAKKATRDRRHDRFLRWVQRLLMMAGLAMLGWCALVVGDGIVSQRLARRSIAIASHSDTVASRVEERPNIRPRARLLVRGSALAELSIPRVRLSAVVLHGSDPQTLRRGPGHLENAALPGELGNVVILGHRDSFFRPLRDIQLGDDIFLDTSEGRHHYQVVSLRVVGSRDLSVLEPTDEASLTLITCYPFWVLGAAPDRFVVRAVGVVNPSGPRFAVPVARPHEPVPAPVVHPTPSTRALVVKARSTGDAEFVQETIERFRLTYNARLLTHREVRPGRPLRFQTCDVTIDALQATATCEVLSQRSNEGEPPPMWTFTLDSDDDGWAIRSIVMEDVP